MKFYSATLALLILTISGMEEPSRLSQIERRSITVNKKQDELERQPGVVKITDIANVCKISKESKIAGLGRNNVKIASFDGCQESILLPPSDIIISEYFGGKRTPCSLGTSKQMAILICQKEKESDAHQYKIGILDIETGAYRHFLKANTMLRSMFYDTKMSRLIAVYPQEIQLWDLKSGIETGTINRSRKGFFQHEVVFSKPKSRIVNVWDGQLECHNTSSNSVALRTETFDPPSVNAFTMNKQEIAVVSTAIQETHEGDIERDVLPIRDRETGHEAYYKSLKPTIRFFHFKNGFTNNVITSNDKDHIIDMCYLKKRDQLIAAEMSTVKLYDINSHQQAEVLQGDYFVSAQSCNKCDTLILQRQNNAYIIDLNKFKLPLSDVQKY